MRFGEPGLEHPERGLVSHVIYAEARERPASRERPKILREQDGWAAFFGAKAPTCFGRSVPGKAVRRRSAGGVVPAGIPTTKAGTGFHPKASIGAAPVALAQQAAGSRGTLAGSTRPNGEFLGGSSPLASK